MDAFLVTDLYCDSQSKSLTSSWFCPICSSKVIKTLNGNFIKILNKAVNIMFRILGFLTDRQKDIILTTLLFFLCLLNCHTLEIHWKNYYILVWDHGKQRIGKILIWWVFLPYIDWQCKGESFYMSKRLNFKNAIIFFFFSFKSFL